MSSSEIHHEIAVNMQGGDTHHIGVVTFTTKWIHYLVVTVHSSDVHHIVFTVQLFKRSKWNNSVLLLEYQVESFNNKLYEVSNSKDYSKLEGCFEK